MSGFDPGGRARLRGLGETIANKSSWFGEYTNVAVMIGERLCDIFCPSLRNEDLI